MKRLTLTALLAALSLSTAQAQSGYTFSVQTGQAYTPLTTDAINLTTGTVWEDQIFTIPIGFSFEIDGQTITSLRISNRDGFTYFGRISASEDTVTAFVAMDGDLHDRGSYTIPSVAQSPIRYAISGTAPSRIFKLEYFNAGFAADLTNADSVNFQIWLYEGSNMVELRYGPSSLAPAHLSAYFQFTHDGPFTGLLRNADVDYGTYGKLFYLRGAPDAPGLDSLQLPGTAAAGLAGYPASGVVYRFMPNGGGVTRVSEAPSARRLLTLYPTAATDALAVEWAGAEGERYQILSATGALVGAGSLQRGVHRIPVATIAAGVYHLRLASGSYRFVKQ